jgi:hypothetical protein
MESIMDSHGIPEDFGADGMMQREKCRDMITDQMPVSQKAFEGVFSVSSSPHGPFIS